MRQELCALAIATAALCPRLATAQSTSTKVVNLVDERITARYDHGAIVVDVALTFRNSSDEPASFSRNLDTPSASTMNRFEVWRDGRWQRASVLSVEEASKLYDKSLIEGGDYLRLGPVSVDWSDRSSVSISAWPIPAGTDLKLRYQAKSYPCTYAGHFAAQIPVARVGRLKVIRGRALSSSSKLTKKLADNCPELDSAPGARTTIAFAAPKRGVTGRWASRAIPGSKQAVADLKIIAGKLSNLPRNANVVFVLDASLSQAKTGGIQAQLARVRDFAAELPSARYQVVAYRRHAHAVLSGWTNGSKLADTLSRLPPALTSLGNGSRFDRGLDVAFKMLAAANGPRRVLLFTDELTSNQATPKHHHRRLAKAMPAGTIVHLVKLEGSAHERKWDGPFADLAGDLGGIYAAVSKRSASEPRSMTDLVRPQVLERVSVKHVGGRADSELPTIDDLREGQGYSFLFTTDIHSPKVIVEGMLWGRRVQKVLTSTRGAQAHLSAFAVAAELVDDKIGKAWALSEGLLSKWTTLLSLPRKPVGAQHTGLIGIGMSGTSSCCGCGGVRRGVLSAQLGPQLNVEPVVRGCAAKFGASKSFELRVQLNYDEIVEVASDRQGSVETCITEGVWDLRASSSKEDSLVSYKIGPGPKIRTTSGR